MGLNELLDAAGPRVEAQILRDMAKDVEGADRQQLLRAARSLEHEARQKEKLNRSLNLYRPNKVDSSPGADAPPQAPGDDAAFGRTA